MQQDNTVIEYELTFLAKEIPAEIRQALPVRYVDFYVPDDPELRPPLRLRRKGNEYEITKKKPLDGKDFSLQQEQTIPLDRGEFESLANGHNRVVEKDRYNVVINGFPAQVDVFSGKLEGLVLIDFEFNDQATLKAFTPPACCLVNVTQELFLAGGQLAGRSYTDIAADLARLNYQPLRLN